MRQFGWVGLFGIVLGIVCSIMGYSLKNEMAFSLMNHTLSELGTYSHSPLAVVVNGGLFFGSLSLVLSLLMSLQIAKHGLGYLFVLLFSLSYIALAAVGLFPTNVYHLHVLALKWFFYLGCGSALLFVVYLGLVQDALFAKWTVIPALLTLLSQSAFLFIPHLELGITANDRPFYLEMILQTPRQALWWPAIIEWLSVTCWLVWSASLLSGLRKTQ